MQRYEEAITDRSSRFQTSMRRSIDSLKLSNMHLMIKEAPRRFREFLIVKLSSNSKNNSNNNNNDMSMNPHQDTYDHYIRDNYGGSVVSVGRASASSKNSSFLNDEPCIYNSGAESDYNASILSDSASMAANLETQAIQSKQSLPSPPICPPPPPSPHPIKPINHSIKAQSSIKKTHTSIKKRENNLDSIENCVSTCSNKISTKSIASSHSKYGKR